MNEWVRAWLYAPGWVTHEEGQRTKRASALNTETKRSFWHKDGSLIGFIWVHLLPGRPGTHPHDPSLFIHPPLSCHVPLCLQPMIPPQLSFIKIIMTIATMAALQTRERAGQRDCLSTCETAGWKRQTSWSVFVLGAPAWRCVLFLLRGPPVLCVFNTISESTTPWRKWQNASTVPNQEKMRFTCCSRQRLVLYLNKQGIISSKFTMKSSDLCENRRGQWLLLLG